MPQLLRCDSTLEAQLDQGADHRHEIQSQRHRRAPELRDSYVPGETKPHSQIDEVRSGGGYFSQNDLRVHFGIGKADKVDLLEIRWPSGAVDTLKDIKVNQVIYVKEGEGIIRNVTYDADKKAPPKK